MYLPPPKRLTFFILCVIILVLVPSKLPSGFLPEMDEGSIVLDYNSAPGTTLEETDRMLQIVNTILDQQPEVEAYSARLGTQMGFFITEPNRGDYLIKLKDSRTKTTDEVSNEIRQKIEAKLPQLTVDFGQVIGDMLGDLMSSAQPIEIKVFGTDAAKLEELSQNIIARYPTGYSNISNIDGTINKNANCEQKQCIFADILIDERIDYGLKGKLKGMIKFLNETFSLIVSNLAFIKGLIFFSLAQEGVSPHCKDSKVLPFV